MRTTSPDRQLDARACRSLANAGSVSLDRPVTFAVLYGWLWSGAAADTTILRHRRSQLE